MLKYILALILLLPAQVWGGVFVGFRQSSTTDANISFYFNCNSATATQTPQKGSGNVAVGSGFTTVTGSVGNALYVASATWEAGRIDVPVTSNLNTSVGTVGFFVAPSSATGPVMNISDRRITYPYFLLLRNTGALEWRYSNTTQTISSINDSTTYFVSLAWDYPNRKMSYKVDNGSWTEVTVGSNGEPTSTASLYFGAAFNDTPVTRTFDQILISSVYQYDLYSVRNNTAF